MFKKAILDFKERIIRAAELTMWLNRDSSKIPSETYKTFAYLRLVESLGNTTVDLVVMLFVVNGRDFHIECQHTIPRIKHAVSIKDLEKERVQVRSARVGYRCSWTLKATFMSLESPSPPRASSYR